MLNLESREYDHSSSAVDREYSGTMAGILSQQPLRQLRAKEHLFHEGDDENHIYRIEDGLIRLYKLMNDGRRQIIAFRYPGDVLGTDARGERDYSADAVTNVTLRSFSRQTVTRNDSAFNREMVHLLTEELASMRFQVAVLNRRSAIEKLSAFVLDIHRRQSIQPGTRLQLEMGRTDIADFLGLTIETVSRNFSKLRQRRIVDLPDLHSILIRDQKRLEALAAGECDGW